MKERKFAVGFFKGPLTQEVAPFGAKEECEAVLKSRDFLARTKGTRSGDRCGYGWYQVGYLGRSFWGIYEILEPETNEWGEVSL